MKCKVCGHTSRTLAAMAEHYRKKHPSKMKRGRGRERSTPLRRGKGARFCPMCGQPL